MENVKDKYDIIIKFKRLNEFEYKITNPWIKPELVGNYNPLNYTYIASDSTLEFVPRILFLTGVNSVYDEYTTADNYAVDKWFHNCKDIIMSLPERILIIKDEGY